TLPGGQPPGPRGGRVAGQAPPPPTPAAEPGEEPATRRPGAAQAAPAARLGPRDREARNHIDDQWQVRIPVTAGDHDVVVAFLKKSSAIDETPRLPFLRPYPAGNNVPETRMGAALRSVEISGPYTAGSAAESPSRRRIFVCSPAAAAPDLADTRTAASTSTAECATRILSRLTRYA